MTLTKTVYDIELKSLKACIHHLQTIDLDEMAAEATVYGTPEDRYLVAAVRSCLAGLPPIHP